MKFTRPSERRKDDVKTLVQEINCLDPLGFDHVAVHSKNDPATKSGAKFIAEYFGGAVVNG